MAQFYTLEEAARVLGMSPEELKAKAQQREVRAFLDGGSWRFRVVDIDELARRRGLGSDPELKLSDPELPAAGAGTEYHLGVANPDLGAATTELPTGDVNASDHDVLLDDLSVPPNPVTGSSSVIIGMQAPGPAASDSDVRLVPDNVKGSSDSDVRIAPAGFSPGKPSDSDVTLIADDTADHGLLKSGSGETTLRPSPQVGSSAEVVPPARESDSDFELTPSNVIDALQPDSGSDFELSAMEASDEFEATPLAGPGDSDVTAADPNISGINLTRPSDSGINLQAASGLDLGASDSIELAPLDDPSASSRPGAGKGKAKLSETLVPGAKAEKLSETIVPGSTKGLSETMVPGKPKMSDTMIRKADKDIFDDTDFEVDAIDTGDSDDRTVQLEATSDFELEEAESGSEVFAIDEEDVDQNAATALGPPPVFEDEDEPSFEEGAVSGEVSSAWDVESETPSTVARAADRPAALLPAGPAAEWGGLWVGLLGAATVFMLLLTFASMEMARNLYDFRAGTPAYGLVQFFAGLLPLGS